MRKTVICLAAGALAILAAGCVRKPDPVTPPGPDPEFSVTGAGPMTEVAELPEPGSNVIPDFSRIGYLWGEKEPSAEGYSVVEIGNPTGGDDTALIQAAIDNAGKGTVLCLAAAEYRVDGIIALNKSGVVLRGAVDSRGLPATVIRAAGSGEESFARDLVTIGKTVVSDGSWETARSASIAANSEHPDAWTMSIRAVRSVSSRSMIASTPIVEDAWCGSLSVTVRNPSLFSVGDRVCVTRPATEEWIHAIGMDRIIKADNDIGTINQWTTGTYTMSWERRVTGIKGDRIFFDNPLVMELTEEFGRGVLYKVSVDRITGSGIENIEFVSDYDPSLINTDSRHAFSAIQVKAAEHCWVRNVTSRYFVESCVCCGAMSRHISVLDCRQEQPAGEVNGGLRYGFHISSGELCLVRNCTSDHDRHSFVTGSRCPGPNAFVDCVSTNQYSVVGPHQRWATGILFDNVRTNNQLMVEDAGNSGTGHGWQGANIVFWNCSGSRIICQSPWVSALNYAIGCNPATLSPGRSYPAADTLGPRPDGICRPIAADEPAKLYEAQLAARLAAGVNLSSILGAL